MPQEVRYTYFDKQLNIEAYFFSGILQAFPNHFHDHYVLGFIEQGQRHVTCKNKHYNIGAGTFTLFNPYDSHACEQINDEFFTYYSLNISITTMQKLSHEITNNSFLPYFPQPIVMDEEMADLFKTAHLAIRQNDKTNKNRLFYLFLEKLIATQAQKKPFITNQHTNIIIKNTCQYLTNYYNQTITLDDLSTLTGLSKYHLLRSFTKQTGISPDNYLRALKIEQAKKFLAEGLSLTNTALQTGFVDHSHFSKHFKKITGITPKQYLKSYAK